MQTKMETIGGAKRTFLPAAGHDWFLPLYDPVVKLLGGDRARKTLLDQAVLRPDHRILDIGCGTGSLVMMINDLYPGVDIVGLDPDPKALTRARRKAKRAGISIQLDQGFSDELPYSKDSFDRVFSSFMFHHLPEDEKEKTLREIRRVLKPGGSLHMVDFQGPKSGAHGGLAGWLHSSHRLKDNSEDRILSLMRDAELAQPQTVSHGSMLFLQTAYYRAFAP